MEGEFEKPILDPVVWRQMVFERLNPRVVEGAIGPGLREELAAMTDPPEPDVWLRLDRLCPEELAALQSVPFGFDCYQLPHPSGELRALVRSRMTAIHGFASPWEEKPRDTREVCRALLGVLREFEHRPSRLVARGHVIDFQNGPALMGILNATPDSFSDGGRFQSPTEAIDWGCRLAEAGASILDIGGQSTRPGAEMVEDSEEIDRVLPVVEGLAKEGQAVLSIDTFRSGVAREALEAGAHLVNDITGLTGDPQMAKVAAKAGAGVMLMHMQGTPATMQEDPQYEDLMGEIIGCLREGIGIAERAGIETESIVVDPGIGFGKTVRHNLQILSRLGELASLGKPILIGTSRKSLIGHILNRPVSERLGGTAATVAWAVAKGAQILRVHDVAETLDVARMAHAMREGAA